VGADDFAQTAEISHNQAMRTAWVAALLALGGCAPDAISSCADTLAGVWAEDADATRRYHVVANRGGYEMYALFDTTVPPDGTPKASAPIIYAPVVYDFQPDGATYVGSRTQRHTRGATICTPRTDARITRCAGNTLEIDIEISGAIDWATCERGPSPGTDRLVLQRQR
jgi:hypothetical protein